MELIQRYMTKNPCYVANVNKADSRYVKFQTEGPHGLMLHSVGCAQPDAMSFIKRWDSPTYDNICVHGFIDANTGTVYQTLPWIFRAWHCGSGKNGSGNNTHIGVEMCESKWIRYTTGAKFTILDKAKAQADCTRAYRAAVELFAMLCKKYNLNPMTAICSHYEGGKAGIASGHVDPEHYWNGLGMPYTMNGFRQDVRSEMEGTIDMTVEQLNEILDTKFANISRALSEQYGNELTNALNGIDDHINSKIVEAVGQNIKHLSDIPWANVRNVIAPMLETEAIDGGTDKKTDATDINAPLNFIRVCTWVVRYMEKRLADLEAKLPAGENK